jgi:hypothetical protein
MPDHQPDSRSLNFAGDVDEKGRPLAMTVEVLRARTEKWTRSPHTPDGIAARLARLIERAHQVTGQAEQLEDLVMAHLAELLVGGRVADRLLRAHGQEPVTGLDVLPGLRRQVGEHRSWLIIFEGVAHQPAPSPLRPVIFLTRL